MSDLELLNLDRYKDALDGMSLSLEIGKVTQVTGHLIQGYVPGATIGSICEVHSSIGNATFEAEVIGFKERSILLML